MLTKIRIHPVFHPEFKFFRDTMMASAAGAALAEVVSTAGSGLVATGATVAVGLAYRVVRPFFKAAVNCHFCNTDCKVRQFYNSPMWSNGNVQLSGRWNVGYVGFEPTPLHTKYDKNSTYRFSVRHLTLEVRGRAVITFSCFDLIVKESIGIALEF